MTTPLQRLIESLRHELQQYGEMLALLEQQRQAILQQGAEDILHSLSAISAQGRVVETARQTRQQATSDLALALSQPATANFQQLIPVLPDHLQPLVTALVQENNALLGEVRSRAHRNHGLLQRSVELMSTFIESMQPGDPTLIPLEQPSPNPLAPPADLYKAIA